MQLYINLLVEVPETMSTLRTPLRELSGHHSVVIAADWLFAGSQLVTASWDRTAILFDAETGENLTTLFGKKTNLFCILPGKKV